MSTNQAAFLTKAKAIPVEVKPAPYPQPRENEMVVQNKAVAINPVEWMIQSRGTTLMMPWLKYPFILGLDIAGEVVEIGAGVERFQVGDRVLAYTGSVEKNRNDPARGGFQHFTLVMEHMASRTPDKMSYESASVIPLGLCTAAAGLFQKDQLALQLPSSSSSSPKSTGETVLIWGGSTSVGSNAIQLAVSPGYEVLTTCSPKNFDHVKRLGAKEVFDYKSPTVVADLITSLKGKSCAGAISIGAGAADACMDILNKCKGKKFVAMATYPMPDPEPQSLAIPKTALTYMSWNAKAWTKTKWTGVGYKFIFAGDIVDDGVGKQIFEEFLPAALANGTFLPTPEPMVVGNGLESVQEAMDLQRKGVSAKKVVITL